MQVPPPYAAYPPPGYGLPPQKFWPQQAPPPLAPGSLSVGLYKISPLLNDELLRSVLEACGPLRSWKRTVDPSTGKPKRFGFAEFESADGMLLAVRVLRDRVLASTEPLLVQLSAVAQRFLDFHVEQLKARARGSAGATIVAPPQPSGSAAPPTELPSDVTAEAEREALTKIEELVYSHLGDAETIRTRLAAVIEPPRPIPPTVVPPSALAAASGLPPPPLPPPPLPPPPPVGPLRVAEADAFLSALAPEDRPGGAERERRESERRESERRDAVRREARVLADKERALERAEAERERERSRELARLREEVRRRQRDLERDLREESASDSDAEPPLSPAAAAEARSRKRYFRRRADERARVERRRLRLREVEEDEAEQRRAALEARDAARKAAEPAKGHKPATSLAQPADGAPPPPPPGPPPNSAPAPAPAPLVGLGLLRRPPAKKAAVAGSGLLTEAEEAPCSRTLVPLQYTEEELRAALVNEYEAAPEAPADAPQEAGVTHSGRREDKEARRRREREEKEARKSLMDLIEAIPTDRATLFAYAVDWDQFDRAGLRATVQRWVAKKVAELLGEAEPSLVEFITAQVAAHVQPEALLTELLAVLDDEAEAFVIKLWRMVIFELKRESHHHT